MPALLLGLPRAVARTVRQPAKPCFEQHLVTFLAGGRQVAAEAVSGVVRCDGRALSRALTPGRRITVAVGVNIPGAVDLDAVDRSFDARGGREEQRRRVYWFVSSESLAAMGCNGRALARADAVYISGELLNEHPPRIWDELFGPGGPAPGACLGGVAPSAMAPARKTPLSKQQDYDRRAGELRRRHDDGPLDAARVIKTIKEAPMNPSLARQLRLLPAAYGGGFRWPLSAGILSSRFGWRWGRPHHGIDLAADSGDRVLASADGLVVFSGQINGYGNVLVIQHDASTSTVYGHNLVNRAWAGQRVRAGATVALLGSTGRSTGPHVHFEIRSRGRPVDPLSLLPRARF